eukprot:TRINITY_DN3341_c0_g1_i1.p1 TRINITY_DN3341_c0_g1~~TRINITY_DN3341_c0_g1_i1.p1  ORF type:complete len:107 (-),score=34.54 TRINITY_DN3341_c0_g1_i1:249-569(-)
MPMSSEENETELNVYDVVDISDDDVPSIGDVIELGKSEEREAVYSKVVRKKDERENLVGFDCEECQKFYDALGGDIDKEVMVQLCSKHRAVKAPPSTPPWYWDTNI